MNEEGYKPIYKFLWYNFVVAILGGKLYISSSRRGQTLLIAVLAMGGIIFGATTIAGFLMIHQLRQAMDAEESAKAIFAADAGLEHGLYQFFKIYDCSAPTSTNCPGGDTIISGSLSNGSTYEITLNTSNETIISRGTAQNVRRAFLLRFAGFL